METTEPEGNTAEAAEAPSAVKQKRFPVIELFGPVIQGEGSQAGQQTLFVRFGGCDYRCTKCDSMHAVDPHAVAKHASYMTGPEIKEKLEDLREATGVEWVTFSGGNPAMHRLDELVAALLDSGWYINVETQGTLWQDWMAEVTVLTVSPKSHGLGEKFEEEKFKRVLQKRGQRPVCIKVVVGSAIDLEFALGVECAVNDAYGSLDRVQLPWVAYYLSLLNSYPPILTEDKDLIDNPACYGNDHITRLLRDYRELSEEVLQDPRLKAWRFLPQIHVLTYGNESER